MLAADRAAAFHLPAFRDHLSLEAGHSENTIAAYQRDLQRLCEFAASKGIAEPAGITTPLLREFVFLLKDLGLSGATIRRNISAVRTWFGFSRRRRGSSTRDPSDRLETPKRWRTLPDVLSVEEMDRLLEAPRVEEAAGLARPRAAGTGLRRGPAGLRSCATSRSPTC